MARPPGHDDRFGRAVASADDEVVHQVELLDGDGESGGIGDELPQTDCILIA